MIAPPPARKSNLLVGAAAVLALLVYACGADFYEIPIETPIQPKLDVSAFQRVLVAGFVAGGTEDVDANQETVRLLRSQLRTKSQLRVIDADILPLVDIAQEQNQAANAAGAPASGGPGGPGGDDGPVIHENGPSHPATSGAGSSATSATSGTSGTAGSGAGNTNANQTIVSPGNGTDHGANQTLPLPQKIKEAKDLEPYERLFANTAYWKRIGEEYQNPLIVTGTVLFVPHSRAGYVQRDRDIYDQFGRHRVIPERTYLERKGFILNPKFVFIDGRTGATMYSESYREEILYNAQQNTPALSSYFELMDRLVPNFLSALSSQKIKGTRVLLK
jgi:hypothetical protein